MIAPFLLCVFAACFSKFVYGKLYNPSTVFLVFAFIKVPLKVYSVPSFSALSAT